MRPRFSLKWLLIAVTVLSVILFVLVIYPKNKAKRFVAGINDGSIDLNQELPNPAHTKLRLQKLDTRTVRGELLLWNWEDLFKVRRRVEVTETMSDKPSMLLVVRFAYKRTVAITVSPVAYELRESTKSVISGWVEPELPSFFEMPRRPESVSQP